MDKFKEKQNKCCPVGGVHCPCCNPYSGKSRAKLNRIARAKLKQETTKESLADKETNYVNYE